jgi:hypothetical protein
MNSENIAEVSAALAKCQAAIRGAEKSTDNTFFKSSYADLASCWAACRQALADNALAVVQMTDILADGRLALKTKLVHSSGQWFESIYPISPIKSDPQGVGSALTYARRYSLCAIVGVAPVGDDDDGEAAHGRGGRDGQQPTAERKQAPKAAEKKSLPPPPDKVTEIPLFICNAIESLRQYMGLPIADMTQEEAEHVVYECRKYGERVTTDDRRQWLAVVIAAANKRLEEFSPVPG